MSSETVIVAKGNLSPEQLESVKRFLGSYGLSAEHTNPEHYEPQADKAMAERSGLYTLPEINSPEQFLAVEHFLDFQASRGKDFSVKLALRAFGASVKPMPYGRVRYEKEPFYPGRWGLIVMSRSEAGLPAIPPSVKFKNQDVVQVGSFLSYSDLVKKGRLMHVVDGFGYGSKTAVFIEELAIKLRQQIVIPE